MVATCGNRNFAIRQSGIGIVEMSENDWRARLSDAEFEILRNKVKIKLHTDMPAHIKTTIGIHCLHL